MSSSKGSCTVQTLGESLIGVWACLITAGNGWAKGMLPWAKVYQRAVMTTFDLASDALHSFCNYNMHLHFSPEKKKPVVWLTLTIHGCNHEGKSLWILSLYKVNPTTDTDIRRTDRDYSKDLYIPDVNLALCLSSLSCFLVDLWHGSLAGLFLHCTVLCCSQEGHILELWLCSKLPGAFISAVRNGRQALSLIITLPRCFPAQNIFYHPSCSL